MAPQLGATFVPGGFDDYYMPEVVAPSPQRYVELLASLGFIPIGFETSDRFSVMCRLKVTRC